MRTLVAVIDDLYRFSVWAVASVFDLFLRGGRPAHRHGHESVQGAHGASHHSVEEEDNADEDVPSSFRTVEEVIDEGPRRPAAAALETVGSTVMYVGGAETPLFREPTVMFDSVVARLPYGAMAMVLEQKGRWAKVAVNGMVGWLERTELVDRAAHVYPHFVPGEENEHDDTNTVRVRAILGDEFGGGLAGLPLQAGEYALYRLLRKGITVPWPETRPRNAGRWHEILRGAPGVSIGVAPRTGSVMEYILDDALGHLAYVEAVFPDESINVSEVNAPGDDGGAYRERVLKKEEWKELRPVFIHVT